MTFIIIHPYKSWIKRGNKIYDNLKVYKPGKCEKEVFSISQETDTSQI